MAELVDALVSGTSIRKDVQVRVLFRALANMLVIDRFANAKLLRTSYARKKLIYIFVNLISFGIFAQMAELVDAPG